MGTKKRSFLPLENSVMDFIKGNDNFFKVGVAENEFLDGIANRLREIDWGLRAGYPLAQ